MNKALQKAENDRIEKLIDVVLAVTNSTNCCGTKKLRSCSASVEAYCVEGMAVCVLKSYSTYVAAVICTENGCTGIDVLRKVYGYTATSAQHIAKFFTDYMRFPCRVKNIPYEELRYYAV